MIEGERVVHTARYAHPIERVWKALIDRDALAAWLMPNDFVAKRGARFRLDSRPTFDEFDCEVLEIEPPRRLQCRWTVRGVDTIVTFALRAETTVPASTVLELEHVLLRPEDRGGFDGGWDGKLRRDLPLVLNGLQDSSSTKEGHAP